VALCFVDVLVLPLFLFVAMICKPSRFADGLTGPTAPISARPYSFGLLLTLSLPLNPQSFSFSPPVFLSLFSLHPSIVSLPLPLPLFLLLLLLSFSLFQNLLFPASSSSPPSSPALPLLPPPPPPPPPPPLPLPLPLSLTSPSSTRTFEPLSPSTRLAGFTRRRAATPSVLLLSRSSAPHFSIP